MQGASRGSALKMLKSSGNFGSLTPFASAIAADPVANKKNMLVLTVAISPAKKILLLSLVFKQAKKIAIGKMIETMNKNWAIHPHFMIESTIDSSCLGVNLRISEREEGFGKLWCIA